MDQRLPDIHSAIQAKREEILSLSPGDLRRAVAASLDLANWPGDAVVALLLIETHGPSLSYTTFNRTFAIRFLGTNGAAAGKTFTDTLFRAWLMRDLG